MGAEHSPALVLSAWQAVANFGFLFKVADVETGRASKG